ncbi:MAG TPA: SUMF1/EgtB/PvdO family nonheme iron enzyme [Thermoanaerobaculia bacterium]|nr:SUMF1/EgtB/PvdO family nonheme iron enzyme [Thermoanaerobaculia bacterium]
MEYSNFDLRIDTDSGGFKAQVLNSGWGEAEHPFEPVFSPDDLGDFLVDLGVASRDASLSKSRPRPKQVAEEIGSKLFKAVFSGDVHNVWRLSLQQAKQKGQGLRLRLFIRDPEASGWPWEYLFDPQRRFFLALSAETPILRYQELPIPVLPLGVEPPLRILAVTAEPPGYEKLKVEEEWTDLKKALKNLDEKGTVCLSRLEHATLERLDCKLKEPFHVLHFIGHGTFASAQNQGTLLFEDGPVTGDELATILRDHDSLRLIILNACEGAKGSRMDRFSGVAQRLVHGGVPAVIAMQFRVTDRAAIAFSRSFYEEIARGRPVDTALAGARKAMFCRRHEVEWGTPVMFSHSSDNRLIEIIRSSSPTQLQSVPRDATPIRWKRVAILFCLLLAGAFILYLALSSNTKGCPPSAILDMNFVRINPGTFKMGSKPRAKKEIAHTVTISKPFCMSEHEVTREQWRTVMGEEPAGNGPDNLPVTDVSWDDVHVFLDRLNKKETGKGYRLSTEAQWEYGAGAGSTRRFHFGDDPGLLSQYGNCEGKDRFDGLAPVKSFKPNLWGLYDMNGNASEWVEDRYGEYPSGRVTDPQGTSIGEERVRRGGSFKILADNCDSVSRTKSKPGYRANDVGFRLVRNPEN